MAPPIGSCSKDPVAVEDRPLTMTMAEFRLMFFANLYPYVGSSPVIYIDPSGKKIWLPTDPISDTIDAAEGLIKETGTPGTACNKWFRNLEAAVACSAAWCTKSFFDAGEPSCSDIMDENGGNLQHPFSACIQSLGNLHPHILMNIELGARNLEATRKDFS